MTFTIEKDFCTLTPDTGKYLYKKTDTDNIMLSAKIYFPLTYTEAQAKDEYSEVLLPNTLADRTDLEAAYAQFKNVCLQIQTFAGLTDFKGGFDEAIAFLKSDAFAADKLTGTYLFSLWQGADKAATYEAAKIGIGQPAWWKECWEESSSNSNSN